jgi:sugar lactone lactonase YvrE
MQALHRQLIVLLVLLMFFTLPGNFGQTKPLAVPPRGVIGDYWADLVLGKPDFSSLAPNEVTGARIFNGGGVIVDRSVRPNRLYAYDGGNSRVLGLSHLGTCQAGSNAGQKCTANSDCSGSICLIQEGREADLVLGQPDLVSAGCNRDNNYQDYPNRATASAQTLCSMPENQVSPWEGGSFANMAVDSSGNLYVPDFDNHRVLLYLSPFTTDTTADAVWGQQNFGGLECNQGRGVNKPDATSLCLRSPFNEGFVGGVAIDGNGGLWITDNQNNRVLHFPNTGGNYASQTADIVLGQPNFTSGGWGTELNKMHAPAAVRVGADGSLFVADSLNNRVLVFVPPFSSGQAADHTLGSGLNLPAGLDFDMDGNVWVNDAQNFQLLRFNKTTWTVDRVLFKDVPTYTGQCGGSYTGDGPDFYFPGPGTFMASYNVCDARGSIGIDVDGNIFTSASTFVQDVWRFSPPFPEPTPGIAHSANAQIFKPYIIGEMNHTSRYGLSSPRGVAVWGSQIIVADPGRLLFWNHPVWDLENGQPADGVVGAPNFSININPVIGPIRTDATGKLWVLRGAEIQVYTLPLVTGQVPSFLLKFPLPVAGGGILSWSNSLDIAGLAVSPDGKYVWIGDPENNRVFRIRDPLTNPTVDILLGQISISGVSCNQGQSVQTASTLCNPAHVTLDTQGNLFVSDHALEVRGNFRLLEFDATLFPATPANILFALPATRVYGSANSMSGPTCQDALCGPWAVAFNSAGDMFVGLNAYIGQRFPLIYHFPLVDTAPDGSLQDYYSMAVFSYVDAYDNIYMTDLNRGRVLIYLMTENPFDNEIFLPLLFR